MIACMEHSGATLCPSVLPTRPSSTVPNSEHPHRHSHPFLRLLPTIRKIAQYSLRRLPLADREEALQEVIASSFVAFTRLSRTGLQNRAFATPLANFGIRQYWAGRRVGTSTNSRDLFSVSCRRAARFGVTSLSQFDHRSNDWHELLVEDRHAGPAEIAISRIDFTNWLASLPPRLRRFALILSAGTSTSDVANTSKISPARVSQIRRLLERSWKEFQGEQEPST